MAWLEFDRRLGHDWRDLATTIGIPFHVQNRFPQGDEAAAIRRWLEQTARLSDLPAALGTIGRGDLVAPVESALTRRTGEQYVRRESGAPPDRDHGGAAGRGQTSWVSGNGRSYQATNMSWGLTTRQLALVVSVAVVAMVVVAAVVLLGSSGDHGTKVGPQPGNVSPSGVAPAGSASRSPSTVLPRSPVPKDLVGTWSGGTTGATANWAYTFTADGTAEQTNGVIGIQRTGTVVVEGTNLTLHFPGRPSEQFRWQISPIYVGGYKFSNLQLNGLSYVRQDAEPR